MRLRVLRSALLLAALLVLPPISSGAQEPPATAAATSFTETFDGDPASPTPWNPDGWDVTIHSRDRHTWYNLEPMAAAHGADCGPPPASRTVSRYEDAVFQCRNHLMTAIKAEGYGVVYLTPNQLVDLSTGEAVIRFDLSTLRTSERDWVSIWVSSYAGHLQLPLDNGISLQGNPRDAIHIRMAQTGPQNKQTFFRANLVRNFVATTLPFRDTPYERVLTPDPARRDTFELRLSKTRVRFGMPAYNLWWVDSSIPELSWDKGIVQLGHHSYNPTKCTSCGPNTWHWDNISITPAVPFTMVKGQTRLANAAQPAVQLAAPTPAGGRLRFVAWGQGLEVSADGGRTWQSARRQPAELFSPGHFQSYWMEVPAGTTAVQFRSRDPNSRDWVVRDVSVWQTDLVDLTIYRVALPNIVF